MRGTKLVRSSPLSSQAASLRRHFCPLGLLKMSKEASPPLKGWTGKASGVGAIATVTGLRTLFARSFGLSPVRLDTQRDSQCISFGHEDRCLVRVDAVEKSLWRCRVDDLISR